MTTYKYSIPKFTIPRYILPKKQESDVQIYERTRRPKLSSNGIQSVTGAKIAQKIPRNPQRF